MESEARLAVEEQIDKLTQLLKELDPKSKEYADVCGSIRNLENALMQEVKYEQDRVQSMLDRDLKQEEIRSGVEKEKIRARWGFFGAVFGGLAAIGTAVIAALSRRDNIRELREIKDDQGIVDRDLVNLTR